MDIPRLSNGIFQRDIPRIPRGYSMSYLNGISLGYLRDINGISERDIPRISKGYLNWISLGDPNMLDISLFDLKYPRIINVYQDIKNIIGIFMHHVCKYTSSRLYVYNKKNSNFLLATFSITINKLWERKDKTWSEITKIKNKPRQKKKKKRN